MDIRQVPVVRKVVNGGQPLSIGVERDHLVSQIIFTGVPIFGDAQLVTLYWGLKDETFDDLIELVEAESGYIWTINNRITQHGGEAILAHLPGYPG